MQFAVLLVFCHCLFSMAFRLFKSMLSELIFFIFTSLSENMIFMLNTTESNIIIKRQ
jgi:hypothetical protein